MQWIRIPAQKDDEDRNLCVFASWLCPVHHPILPGHPGYAHLRLRFERPEKYDPRTREIVDCPKSPKAYSTKTGGGSFVFGPLVDSSIPATGDGNATHLNCNRPEPQLIDDFHQANYFGDDGGQQPWF